MEKACMYCNSPKDGNIPKDHKYLLKEELVERRNAYQDRRRSFSFEEDFVIWADIYGDELMACWSAMVDGGITEEHPCRIAINYCPMCGRELRRSE